ncbi:MAG: aspartate kinase [Desulfotignum sp.]|nr:aspartate kinase [Desulfotignum sp.]MCF8137646.1 aspartate kinase [Desulfotignum sp.]
MKVIKIGGGCLKDGPTAHIILDLAAARGKGSIFVVSAFYGITNTLISGIEAALASEDAIEGVIRDLRHRHQVIVDCLMEPPEEKKQTLQQLDKLLGKLERYYFGISFTREATPRMRDIICVFGERMSAMILAAAMASRGIDSGVALPEEAGIITDGKFMDATALMAPTWENLCLRLGRQVTENKILFVPGFYGVSATGEITTFGRGGSDYSAAVVAAGVDADILEIWKDTPGFMTADPDNIPECRLIPELTYEEAAELAYTGAGILHPRTVEPVRQAGIDIAIKNTYAPDARGSRITRQAREADTIIKSVSYTSDVAILKIHASGVGVRQGILSLITGAVSGSGINIKSVVTSQTCISLLVSKNDAQTAHDCLRAIHPRPFRESDCRTRVALVSIVGEGLHLSRGIAARCFTAVSRADVNIEMISFGASDAAMYFLVHEDSLDPTIQALHNTFFNASPPPN